MSVVVEPANQLWFKRPLTRLVAETLTVRNTHADQYVAFKVKTTAPKTYCVRPNSGKIKPGEAVHIQVLLQPMKEDPPKDYKCKDKFLVQSAAVAAEHQDMPIADLWSLIEAESRSKIVEHKVRCVFLDLDDGVKPRPTQPTSEDAAPAIADDEVQQRPANPESQIEQVAKQPSEIRQRRKESLSARPPSAPGVRTPMAVAAGRQQFSVEVVALVAILSFLLGYLFF